MLKNIIHQILSLLYFLPGFGQDVNPQLVARLDERLAECSGIAQLPSGNLAMINDSGNPPEVFITDKKGNILKSIALDFAQNRDWEELVYANGILYIGDFGNNANKRQDLKIYRVGVAESDSLYPAGEITYRYSRQKKFPPSEKAQHYDMEAMVFKNDSLFLFSKNRSKPFTGYTYLYGFPADEGDYLLSPTDSFKTGHGLMHLFWIAGAALNDDGTQLALLSYDKLWLFSGFPGSKFFSGNSETFHFDKVSQREAISFLNDSTLLVTNESSKLGEAKIYEVSMANLRREEIAVKVSPKHLEDSLTLEFSGSTEENIYWEIFGTKGERMLYGTIRELPPENIVEIDITELPPGGYVLNVIIEGRPRAFKLKKPLRR